MAKRAIGSVTAFSGYLDGRASAFATIDSKRDIPRDASAPVPLVIDPSAAKGRTVVVALRVCDRRGIELVAVAEMSRFAASRMMDVDALCSRRRIVIQFSHIHAKMARRRIGDDASHCNVQAG